MRHVGTTAEVVEAFLDGRPMHTAAAPVPGGYRVSTDGTDLYSYRTVIATRVRAEIGQPILVGLRRYSVTTSKLQGLLRRLLASRGYEVDGSGVFPAAVPGRWNGWGPAWHPTGRENVPADAYRRA